MRYCAVVLCGLVFAPSSWSQTGKVPLPSEKDLLQAEKLVDELYREEIAKAKDPTDRARIALTLLQEAKETHDYPAGKYLLLALAHKMAAGAGDVSTALQAVEELGQSFRVPLDGILDAKIGAIASASAAHTSKEHLQTIVDSALVLLEDTLALDSFPASQKLLQAAEQAARQLKNVPLVSSLRKRGEDMARLEKEFAKWKPFADKLRQSPDDPKANSVMGAYYAFVKGDWDRGLPMLKAGDDAALRFLAQIDLMEQAQLKQPKHLAEHWLKQSEGKTGATLHNVLQRAAYWYQQALPSVTGTEKTGIEKQLQTIMQGLPPELRIGEIAVELKRWDGHAGPVYAAAFSPDGRKAVSVGADGLLHLWDTKTGKEQRRFGGQSGRIWCVAFAPDGRRVVTGGFDGSVRVWDLTSGRESRRFLGHSDYVRGVAFTPDGEHVLSVGDDRAGRLWNVETGKEEQTLNGHEHFVWGLAISRDGQRALTAGLDKTVRLWDLRTGKELKVLNGHKDTVLAVAFAPNGKQALSGGSDKTLILWDLETGQPAGAPLTGHQGYVHAVAFSPDGRRALSTGQDKSLRLWDMATGNEIRALDGHTDQVWSVSYSRDGRWALSAGQDQAVRLWGSGR